NKEQMPSINHEGCIKEVLLPKTFNLERFSNHTFIIPQGTTDTTKNFGDGTTFFSVIEGDGLVDEVIDWDQEDDGASVGFRLPSFATDTLLNLKQHAEASSTTSVNDEANELNLEDNQLFGIAAGTTTAQKFLFTVDATAPASVSNIGNTTIWSEDMTFHSARNRLLICTSSFAEECQIYAPDLIIGDIFEEDGSVPLNGRAFFGLVPGDPDASSFGISSMESNPNDGILYMVYTSGQRLVRLDLDDIDLVTKLVGMTPIGTEKIDVGGGAGSTFFFGMGMDTTNNIMYGASSFTAGAKRLFTINLTTGVGALVHPTNLLTRGFTSLTYDKKADKLYGLDGFVGNNAELFEIDRSTGLDTSLGVFTPPSKNCQGIAAKPPDESFWLVDNFLRDESLRLTNSPGVLSDVYLRFR
ncbi:hypothetical protein LCGC14_2791080, partial [marine sediment metagenome]